MQDILGKLRVQAVAGFMGDVRQTFNQFDTNGNGLIDKDELGSAIRVLLGFDPGDVRLLHTTLSKDIVRKHSEVISNWADVQRALMGTEHAKYLADVR